MRALLHPIRFLLELLALVAVGVGAWSSADGALRWAAAAVGVLVLAVVWGTLVAPRSPRRLADPWRLAVEILVFAVVGFALAAWSVVWGVVLGAAGILVAVLLRLTGEAGAARPS